MTIELAENYERIEWDRAHRAPRLEEMFGWQYTRDAGMPDPGPLASNIALGVIECLAGIREPEQLGRWLMPNVFQQLLRKHSTASRRQTRGRVSRSTFQLLHCRQTRISESVAEAVGIVSNGHRARAVAMRFETIDRRWRITSLEVL